ncbi:MAG: ribosome recycling factor [Erysipelotrichaceae bacterium]|nr:ribosome recycling factor [Erysipelotrichaceae bacterium]
MKQILDQATEKMQKAIVSLESSLTTIRTGRANASILDQVQFEYYGSMTPIQQVASIQVVEGRQLVIKPYDKGTLKDIEKAIAMSDTGLVPQNDGTIVRINVPALTEERRQELSKNASKMGEEAKIVIRNIRRDANDQAKKNAELTEDMKKQAQEKIQKLTDDFTKKIDAIITEKTNEIMSI